MSKYWFERDWSSDDRMNRRHDANRLRRIVKDSERQEQSQIERWLELAEKVLADDDPDPAAD